MTSHSRNNVNNSEEYVRNILTQKNNEELEQKILKFKKEYDAQNHIKKLDYTSKKPWILFLGLSK